MMTTLLLLATGLMAGLLSGLLGIGGGIVVVPCLLYVLHGVVPPKMLMKVALATSLACIAFTGLSLTIQQYKAGNVNLSQVKQISLGVALGASVGGFTAALVSTTVLKIVFIVFSFYIGGQMIIGKQPKIKAVFNRVTAGIAGTITGALSSWIGIGGGTVVVPFLLSTGSTMHQAVGSSSAVGIAVALFSSLGYAYSAYMYPFAHVDGLWGLIHGHAFLFIITTSVVGAYLGVRIGKATSPGILKKIFGAVFIGFALKMLMGMI